jgi:hypothetical protein
MTSGWFAGPRRRAVGLACALAALSGCADVDTSGTGSPTAPVGIDAGSLDQAVATVAARLTAGGYRVLSTDVGGGIVTASMQSAGALDCGTVEQTYSGQKSSFPGTAPRAVVFAANMPGGLVVREVAASSEVTVRIRPGTTNTAFLGERHSLRISQKSANGARLIWSETQVFDGESTVKFADGTICRSSGMTRKSLR